MSDVDGQGDERAATAAAESIRSGRWDRWLVLISGAIKVRRDELARARRLT